MGLNAPHQAWTNDLVGPTRELVILNWVKIGVPCCTRLLVLFAQQEEHLVLVVKHSRWDGKLIEVRVGDLQSIGIWKDLCSYLLPIQGLSVWLKDANCLVFVHQVEVALVVEEKVYLRWGDLKNGLDEGLTSHLWLGLSTHDLHDAIVIPHHPIDGAHVVLDHRLADHFLPLGSLNYRELLLFLKVVVKLFPLFKLLLILWHWEANRWLFNRGHTVEDDTVAVLGNEG